FALINSSAVTYVVATFYLFGRVSVVLFEPMCADFRRRVIVCGRINLVRCYYDHFIRLCLMVHRLNQFFYMTYVTSFVCALPNVANMYFISIHDSRLCLVFRVIYFLYMVYMLS